MNTPKIRFKGFTDAWEQRKLESLCDVFMDGDWIEAKDQSNAGIRLVQTGNVGTTKYLNKENNQKWISEETFERLHCKEIYSGDILISRLPEPAGRACIVPELGTRMITAVDCTIVRTAKEYDSKYLVQYLSTTMYFKIVNSFLGGGTRQRISRGNLSGIDIPVPGSLDEQKKIGEYFSKLDHLITLHQRKCDETKQLKKFMLQKMFPKNGEKNPEIRFEGFTDDWEQRKFGDYNDLMTGYPFESDKFSEDGIKLVRGMNVKRGYLDFSGDICVKWNSCVGLENFLLKDGDILIQMDGALIGKSYAKIKENQLPALLVQRVTRARTNNKFASQDFMYQTIQRDFLRYIEMNKTETAVPHLSLNDIRNFEIMVPCLAEQKKIGEYFDSLDNLITLHQRKCEKLKELKKFMLQNMFV